MPPDLTMRSGSDGKRKPGQKRTRTGCDGCRKRKHKCDESKPICQRCSKNGDQCLWPTLATSFDLCEPSSILGSPSSQSQAGCASSSSSTFLPSLPPSHSSPWPPSPPSSSLDSAPSTKLYKKPRSLLALNFANQERTLISHFLSSLLQCVSTPPPSPFPPTSSSPPTSPEQIFAGLDLQRFLSLPRGSSTSLEALSLAILSVAATQLSFRHNKSAQAYLEDTDYILAASSIENRDRYTELGVSLSNASMALGKSSALLISIGGLEDEPALQLLTLTSSMLLSGCCLGGGRNFREVLEWGKSLVSTRGGPTRILREARSQSDVKHTRRVRAVLEELVAWELFGALSTGDAPDLSFTTSNGSSDLLCSWYFNAPPTDAVRDVTSEDWDTVVGFVGIPRGMIQLLNRVTSLYNASRSSRRLSAGCNQDPFVVDPIWKVQANLLLKEIALLTCLPSGEETDVEEDGLTPLSRLDSSTLIFADTLDVILRVDLLGFSRHHPDVHSRAGQILQRIRDCPSSRTGYLWPCIVAGSMVSSPDARAQVRATLDLLSAACLYELNAARSILQRVWEKRDEGDASASWRSVVAEVGGLLIF